MSARCSLVVNGKAVRVSTGDTPLEAALAEGMIAPTQGLHGTLLLGQAMGAAARRGKARRLRPDALKLSQAGVPIAGPAETPPLPVSTRKGTLTQVTPLSANVVEIVVTLTRRLILEPGHQVEVGFEGLESLTLSPTLRVDGSAELNELVFHLPRDSEGRCLTDGLSPDAAVKVRGPVGRGQYRPGGGRLVLVAAGTGFGPVWSIARAARYIEPAREMTVMVGARDALDLYMRDSLDWLRRTGVGRIVLVADRGRQRPPDVRPGPLTAHLPPLNATDVVHVAGGPSTVGAVQVLAASVGARCYPILTGDA
ncbi:ferredoxin--NAD(+) reductase [Methylobacterium trifolii]|uniref:Dihydroorotate dehydrogenase B (NAD(+)), electron transfer subunit n=1 Tax=Methylobacterium trifolii TaxID=1003092 RepID=A0ABQ4U1B6_9HYPH|nr:ferredoxin--NAD(+) reductase [Methylobacterium trifolii]GJE60657.1 Dihydroorotate dehydrogenase B (NAD(+)), electron transfer subunit [Methylobacterium trifolii]